MSFPSSPANNDTYVAGTGETWVWRNDKSAWRKYKAANETTYFSNKSTIGANVTIAATGQNALSAGPVEIADGVTVTVPSGVTWTIVGE